MSIFGKGIDTAKYIADVSTALERIAGLEKDQERLSQTLEQTVMSFQKRFADLEAEVRVLKAEVRTETVEFVHGRMHDLQREFHGELRDLAVAIDRVEGPGDQRRLPPQDDQS